MLKVLQGIILQIASLASIKTLYSIRFKLYLHFDVSLTTAEAKVQLMNSMHHVERIYSCAFFVPRIEQRDYVYFEPGERCIIVNRSLLQMAKIIQQPLDYC